MRLNKIMNCIAEELYTVKFVNELQVGEAYQLINGSYVITALIGTSKVIGLLYQYQPFIVLEKHESYIGNDNILKISSKGVAGFIRIKEGDNCLFE